MSVRLGASVFYRDDDENQFPAVVVSVNEAGGVDLFAMSRDGFTTPHDVPEGKGPGTWSAVAEEQPAAAAEAVDEEMEEEFVEDEEGIEDEGEGEPKAPRSHHKKRATRKK